MKAARISVREARRTISQILTAGKTVAVGDEYSTLRGFIVGVLPHERWDQTAKRKALKEAKARFTAAWIAETQE